MSKRKQPRSRCKLPAKQRKLLIGKVIDHETTDLKERVIEKLKQEQQFVYFPRRRSFLDLLMDSNSITLFEELLSTMVNVYNSLLKLFCTGKKSLEFKNSWFFHIRACFDQGVTVKGVSSEAAQKLYDVWQNVISKAVQSKCSIGEEEQRVFLATMAAIVYDIKAEEVKAEKELAVQDVTVPLCGEPLNFPRSEPPTHSLPVPESTISLYHYAGYALHSLIQVTAKKRGKQGVAKNDDHEGGSELEILKKLQCKSEDMIDVPEPIKEEARTSSFCVVSPNVIPFVRLVVNSVSSAVSEEQLKSKGQHMVADAKNILLSMCSQSLIQEFQLCVRTVLVEETSLLQSINIADILERIGKEFTNKIANARINEFFKARKELDLEADKKVVGCEQSLRDKLKTFSSLKSRE